MNRVSPLHPVSVWYRFRRGLPLLLVPLLRLLRGDDTLRAVLAASFWELIAAGLLFCWALLHHRHCRLRLTDSTVSLFDGVLFRRQVWLPDRQIAVCRTERSPLLALCGAVRLVLFPAGKPQRAAVTCTLPRGTDPAYRLSRRHPPFFSRLFPTFVLAASSSNAAVGLLALIPAVRSLSWLIEDLPRRVIDGVEQTVPLPLPEDLERIADVLLFGWLFAFLRGLWYYAGFALRREGDRLHLTSGLITRRDTRIALKHVTALTRRQTLFTRLFGLCTLSATVAGYGQKEPLHPVLFPAIRQKALAAARARLLPHWEAGGITLRPNRRAKLRYTAFPLVWLLGGLLLFAGGGWLFPVGGLAVLFGGWWLLLRLVGWHRAGIGRQGGYLTLCYPKGLGLYEQQIRETAVVRISCSRSPWQRRSGTCHVTVLCRGDAHPHTVKALPYEKVRELLWDG